MDIIIYIYDGMTMLDAIGPYEVLRALPNAEIKLVASAKKEIRADSDFVHLNAKYSIDDIDRADILLIPGSTIAFVKEAENKKLLKWIRKIDQTTSWTTSVCSGSIILAAAGVLKGLKASSHWKVIPILQAYGATPTRERIVEQGKYLTAAGVSAGIDMALYLVNRMAGEEESKAIQLMIEYDPDPIHNAGNYHTAEESSKRLAEQKLSQAAKKELSLLDMIKHGRTLFKLS